jgi:hypothetical protein
MARLFGPAVTRRILIGETRSADASILVVPMQRLDPELFQLRSGVAGQFVQKFASYGI